jgi:hypothetical protein
MSKTPDPSEYDPSEYVYNRQYLETANAEKLAILKQQVLEEEKRRTPPPDPTQMTPAQFQQWSQQEVRKGEQRRQSAKEMREMRERVR